MTTVDEIEAAVSRLTPLEREDLFRRLAPPEPRGDDWDRQMRADASAGKFDALVAAAKADHAAGLTRTVP